MSYAVFLYFFIAILISWGAKFLVAGEITGWFSHHIPRGILDLIAAYGPSAAGLIMIFSERGKKGFESVVNSISRLNIKIKWFLFAIFFELVTFVIVVLSSSVIGIGNISIKYDLLFRVFTNFLISTIILSVLTGLGEEIGWRGFLLPKLLSRHNVLPALLILSIFNSLWHLKTDYMIKLLEGDFSALLGSYLPDMGQRILITIPVNAIIIYLFNKTGGSLLIMIIFHGSSNASWEWVKEITGINDPSFLFPVWIVLLWLTMLYFIPALLKQKRNNEIVINIS